METTQSTHQQQPPQAPRPRLERLRGDRVLGGVASGIARHLGVDTAWVRIAFVILALFGGAGILAYIVGWIAIPEEGEQESMLVTKTRSSSRIGSWIGIGLIALAVMILIGNTGLVDGDIIFAAALIIVGLLLYRGDLSQIGKQSERATEDMPVSPSLSQDMESAGYEAPLAPPAAYEAPVPASYVSEETAYAAVPPESPVTPAPPAPAFQPRAPRPRSTSVLGRLTMASLLIVLGVMGVGQSAGWWTPYPRHYAGAVLATLGVALLIGALFGRARWLIALGLVTAPLLIGAALLDVPIEGGWGNPQHAPATVAELAPEYRLAGGELILDLTDLELAPDQVYHIESSVAFGSLEIRVPDGLGVNVVAQVDAGEILIDGAAVDDGINLDQSRNYDGTGLIDLDAHVGFGQLNIYEVEE